MTGRKLIQLLRQQNIDLEVRQFDADHNPEIVGEGGGTTMFVEEIIDNEGNRFIALQT